MLFANGGPACEIYVSYCKGQGPHPGLTLAAVMLH